MNKIILASQSPRRKELLSRLGLDFTIMVPNVDESAKEFELPDALVLRLSKLKAQAILENFQDSIIIAADTVVAIEGKVLGKPKDRSDAFDMIKRLSGRSHQVYTGATVLSKDKAKSFVVATEVEFASLDDKLITEYVNSGESDDKAGAYAIQGLGSMLINSIKGSVSSVIGLPLCELREALAEFNLYPNLKK